MSRRVNSPAGRGLHHKLNAEATLFVYNMMADGFTHNYSVFIIIGASTQMHIFIFYSLLTAILLQIWCLD